MTLRELDAYARLPLAVSGAEGCELILEDGRRVLDLYGGHCVNTLGAGDEALGRVLGWQWKRLSFVTNLIDGVPSMDVGLAWRRGADLSPVATAFQDYLRLALTGSAPSYLA